MGTENVQAQENYEQEEFSNMEDTELTDVATEDDFVPPTKAEYKKLQRQAYAYQALKGAEVKQEVKPNVETMTPVTDSIKFKKLELKIDGYSSEEIELIEEFGFDKADNPIVKKAIETMRSERKSKEADPNISNKSAVYKKYTNDDLKNMSVEELRKILPHAN